MSINNDDLKIYRGTDIRISDSIFIHQPSLDEIIEYGEKEYYQMVYTLLSTPSDMMWQLDRMGINYVEISEFELFSNLICKIYPKEDTKIILGDLDLSRLELFIDKETGNNVLRYDLEKETNTDLFPKHKNTIIDEYTYMLITDYLRRMHGLEKPLQNIPANEFTRIALIETAYEEYLNNKDKEYQSQLLNIVSTLVNIEGFKFNYNEIWDMKIYAFMDSLKRISKIRNANMLIQSGYSGFGVDLKKINKKELDWSGSLD